MSPRTWGWTHRAILRRVHDGVVPTHVGVDPLMATTTSPGPCCPHARGGGPSGPGPEALTGALSPRTWGWTRHGPARRPRTRVVPTHVGVDPSGFGRRVQMVRCPHARGGGPSTGTTTRATRTLSPRTWGWTDSISLGLEALHVVPTHVGVDLTADFPSASVCRCPHARGGGPFPYGYQVKAGPLSPRTWGWTRLATIRAAVGGVVPTHVGVDR